MDTKKSAAIILDDPEKGVKYSSSKSLREKLRVRLHSRSWQLLIIFLVILDSALVGTDIVLSSFYCGKAHPPHIVEEVEEWLRAFSIAILSFFVAEWLVEAYVHGFRRWFRTVVHAADLIIVVVSLALEVVAVLLHSSTASIGGLLIVFRLWRVVRVMHAVSEVQHKANEQEISELQNANDRLQKMQGAQHQLIKALHREFVQRLAVAHESRQGEVGGDDSSRERLRSRDPSLDDILDAVARHSTHLQDCVSVHRASIALGSTQKEAQDDSLD